MILQRHEKKKKKKLAQMCKFCTKDSVEAVGRCLLLITTLEESANLNDAQPVIHCTACFSSLFLRSDPCSPVIPDVAPGAPAASSNRKCLLLNFERRCAVFLSFSPHPPPLHPLPGGLHLKLSPPTSFLTSWSLVFFLTAVQPLLSDGLFCCLKHLIGGQVYIIRGESLSLPPGEVLPC